MNITMTLSNCGTQISDAKIARIGDVYLVPVKLTNGRVDAVRRCMGEWAVATKSGTVLGVIVEMAADRWESRAVRGDKLRYSGESSNVGDAVALAQR